MFNNGGGWTHLVVGHEAGLARVLAGGAAAGRRGADVELAGVYECEGAAVRRHPDHQLLLGCSLLHPLPRTVVLQEKQYN